MTDLTPQNRRTLITTLRVNLSDTDARDIADDFGLLIKAGYDFYSRLPGNSRDERIGSLVTQAQQKDALPYLQEAVVNCRPDLAAKMAALLTDAPAPQPAPIAPAPYTPPQLASPPVQKPTAQDEAKAKEYYERGVKAREADDYDLAITLYTLAIDLKPDYVFAYVSRGVLYNDFKHEYDKALADYTKAIALDPNARAYYNRGISYNEKREYDKAIADLNKAIALDPNYAFAYNTRGNSYYGKGDYDKALADYTKAIALDPNDAVAYNNRGLAYKAKGDRAAARRDLQLAADLGHERAKAELGKFWF